MIPWREHRRIPRDFAAVLESLRLDSDGAALRLIDGPAWTQVLALCDREHLTLPLYRTRAEWLPKTIVEQCEERLAKNTQRVRRLQSVFAEISNKFRDHGIEYAVLKGFTQYPDFVADLYYRVQYDVDFLCPETSVYRARETLRELGYEPLKEMGNFPTDHLPVMIRKTGWQWRNDYFDPDIPVSVDLHFRFWDPETEGFDAPGVDEFPSRMCSRRLGQLEFHALHAVDALGYHCLHLLRHLLRASLRLSHVYELAFFLETHKENEEFWRQWHEAHTDGLRRLEGISFRLAQLWFGCELPPLAREEVERLPTAVQRWFAEYASAPIENLFRPNKHELWLHLALVESAAAKRKVIRRRLFPGRLPGPVDAVYVPDEQLTAAIRMRRRIRYASHLAERSAHHVRTLPSVGWHAVLWQLRSLDQSRRFWQFIAAASLFNFGVFVFVLIYNLYLLDRGYREDFIGLMNGAFTAGSVAGALPAGAILQRLGIAFAFRFCILFTALIFALRALLPGEASIIGFAFCGGSAFALWAVTIAPAIAQLTTEHTRARGFSLFFAISITIGVVGGVVGGRLPTWLSMAFPAIPAAAAKQAALVAASSVTLLALWPAKRLQFSEEHRSTPLQYPLGPFVRRFLLALAGWNLAVGAFNPFFNTFFARQLNAGVEQIGLVFSAGQIAQVAAMLGAPVVLKRLGLVNGVTAAQICAGLALAALAASPTIWVAATAYAGYSAFQYMSEPGMYTLLMSRVRPEQQSGASSLNFLAAFCANAAAAMLAGAALSRFGYPAVIAAAAILAIVSALLFRTLLRGFE